ncbi:hypothetical protein ABH930_005043 [Kitasatospora sp. GAS204A]|uniref:hypothetical protein n=1 Tax=unclassified Kitasatospora TaxID=2633591 RepID=UPI0024758B1A|nr:hypothetical protein [Kitasatospora sp. GAS204B]MDH6120804.1 hypothetical protein [Kitasatospora sp. GAS204B]
MDPVSVSMLLAAFAGGAGGEAGKQALEGAWKLVRRPFQRPAHLPAASSGEAELVALEQAPADPALAQQLSMALGMRAAMDPEFAGELTAWEGQAKLVRIESGTVYNNTINGGIHGMTIQAGKIDRVYNQTDGRG